MSQHPVDIVFTKWGDRPHWEQRSQYLGEDEYGHWVGCPSGQYLHRPGLEVTTVYPMVMLAPESAQWVASFRGHSLPPWEEVAEVYVDVTGPVHWTPDRSRMSAVDLDLDVLRLRDGTVFVDDEDEFAEHRLEYGYPSEVVAAAQQCCDQLVERLRRRSEPFGDAYREWLSLIS